jgi:hypothetical protein
MGTLGKTICIATCLCCVLIFSGFPAEQKTKKQSEEDQTIRVDVEMVSLPVVVTTRGRPTDHRSYRGGFPGI